NESLKILKETNALLEGHFILSSGLHSNQYVQCAKLLSYPKQAEIICAALTEKIKSNFNKIDIVLSPALGGIVVGYEIGKQLNTQTIFAERSNNKLVLRRGFAIPQDSNVLIVEDVITTGKSAIECSEIVKINKANLIGFACVIDRSDNNVLIKEKIVSQIKIKIAIFKENELPDELKKTPAVKPGSRNLSNDQN
ncbi:MAG TPA: orotate phosphoribosyltransferase, partial [Pelagibacteraceae bacterium]|nr:orotate phosphoribosyltransferase [Pelagibacteraceae bacterium]